MDVYTIGFARKSAEEFFTALRSAGIRRLIDVRLHNSSQLAGFTKQADLAFFLKELCGIEYMHVPMLAPTEDIFDEYKKRKGSAERFAQRFLELMAERKVEDHLPRDIFAVPTVLLCGEVDATHCHRRLVLDYLAQRWPEIEARHL